MSDPAAVRKAIYRFADSNPNATYERVVSAVEDELDVARNTITKEIGKMQRAEFLYLNENGDTTKVTVA
jgi:hypothetical protein